MTIETLGGIPTRGEAYARLMHHLRECQEQAAILGHFHNTEGTDMDKLLAKGWLGMSEMFKMTQMQVTKLAMSKMQ